MKDEICSSELLAQKLQHINSMFQLARRTLDSSDGSIFLDEVIDLLGAGAQMTQECETLRQRIDVDLYQKNSKYYELLPHE